jgi:HPt (histidine-containing phosphotransfer) domain-containing protein
VDWARLEELRAEVGAEALDEIIDMFVMEMTELVDKLRSAPDPDMLEADLHFLRGSALNLGFAPLAEVCQTAELQSRRGDPAQVDLSVIIRTYESCLGALNDYRAAA